MLNMNNLIQRLQNIKAASNSLAYLDDKKRQDVLIALASRVRESIDQIMHENKKDLALMDKQDPKYDRLLLSETAIQAMADDILSIAHLPNPLHKIIEEKTRPNGLRIQKVSVPLGVVAVIYESRPNVTLDVFALCFRTGNACVLKGGKEAFHSNQYLANLIQSVLHSQCINEPVFYLLPPEREATLDLISAIGLIDVCIPRGSQSLINFVREHAKVPIIETGAGVVHTYFDVSGDESKGRLIIHNAKTRRVSVCNALDTLIIHIDVLPSLKKLVELLAAESVDLYADDLAYIELNAFYPIHHLHKAKESDFGREFLDYKMSIKTVSSIEDAVKHVMKYTSGHSEAIIAEDEAAISYFLSRIDAAAVYVNTSTAFTDGGQFGMSAEIGISTQKLHARGPMGLEALTSYKWIVWGDGQIRNT